MEELLLLFNLENLAVASVPTVLIFLIYILLLHNIRVRVIELYDGILKFYEKYKELFSGEIKSDFNNMVIIPFDKLLESVADMLERLRLKKSAQKLRDVIK
jgi:hypothetical protein